jgi:hypothetical protein
VKSKYSDKPFAVVVVDLDGKFKALHEKNILILRGKKSKK